MGALHHTRAPLREAVAVIAGVVGAVAVTEALGLAAGLLAGWALLAAIDVAWVLAVVWRMDAAQTRAHALIEDPGRRVARVVAVLGSVASLGAVVVVLVQTRDADEVTAFVLAGVAVVAVAASWALIQVDYLLRYAREYYGEPEGGIDFNQAEPPAYTDFAYFSLGLGMTYQVADTNVTRGEIRRIVIAQTLLAYLFGAVILATVINLVTSLG
ncbi:DUF1345 domain-containing protein [Microbacterium sp. T2.11-28]|uniref:DUF1345 domain-containing protein n=1 Tax=unclassified Microbacterium TaxID=2609290 RepID=UPI002477C221|nr:DUF1345 domain-containing protein [Microbacterium sp. T2.11-28]CAI9386716.1 hypothetical protein MICABA_00552 [Microbacterium sp. T2.11-28]